MKTSFHISTLFREFNTPYKTSLKIYIKISKFQFNNVKLLNMSVSLLAGENKALGNTSWSEVCRGSGTDNEGARAWKTSP